jgi:hypothetical protein
MIMNQTRRYLFLAFFMASSSAWALSCNEVPDAVRDTFVHAYDFYRTYVNPKATDADKKRFAVRISYAHNESTFYPLAANDESYSKEHRVYRLKGLEIAQDLSRIDNKKRSWFGGSDEGRHRATLSSYHETFNRAPYTIKVGGFNTRYSMAALGRMWQPGDVAPRFDVVPMTNFGMLQVSADQYLRGNGVYRRVLLKMRELAKDHRQVDGLVDWCRSRAFYKDSQAALRQAFGQLANSGCDPTSRDPICYGRWHLLCPTYNVLMGASLPEAYFAAGTRRRAKELCYSSFN